MRSNPVNVVYESLSEMELRQFEENQEIIQEKKLERWNDVTSQRQTIIFASIILIPIVGIVSFLAFRRKRK